MDNDSVKGPIEKLYETMATTQREPYEKRAEQCAELTIPALFRDQDDTRDNQVQQTYQSLGARGTNSLSSKVVLALFPPNAPFFKIQPDFTEEETDSEDFSNIVVDIKNALSKVETKVTEYTEQGGFRSPIFEAVKQLIVAGNVLMNLTPDGHVIVWTLRNYVTRRAASGKVLEIILRQTKDTKQLSNDMLEKHGIKSTTKKVNVFTHIKLDKKTYRTRQELNGMPVEGSEGSYPEEKLPYIALTYRRLGSEHYGRSFVEDYTGDLKSLEGLTQAVLEGSAAAARGVIMVNPNGTTDSDDITNAENWAVIEGDEKDVSVLRIEKVSDFNAADRQIERLEKRLSYVFMLNTSVQRKGERVTLGEIRYLAGELEDTLGGVYSQLARELQLPVVKIKLAQLQKQGKIPSFNEEDVKITITTGIDALGRSQDLQKKQLFLENISVLGPQAIAKYVKTDKFITAIGTDTGVDTKDFIRTEEEATEYENAQIQKQMVQENGPQMAQQLMQQAQEEQ